MKRSPLDFACSFVGEPEPRRRWLWEFVVARALILLGVVLVALLLSLSGCGGASGEIAKGMLIRDAVAVAFNVALIAAFVVAGLVWIFVKDAIDARRRRKRGGQ